jgi:hypothetical protein
VAWERCLTSRTTCCPADLGWSSRGAALLIRRWCTVYSGWRGVFRIARNTLVSYDAHGVVHLARLSFCNGLTVIVTCHISIRSPRLPYTERGHAQAVSTSSSSSFDQAAVSLRPSVFCRYAQLGHLRNIHTMLAARNTVKLGSLQRVSRVQTCPVSMPVRRSLACRAARNGDEQGPSSVAGPVVLKDMQVSMDKFMQVSRPQLDATAC